MSKITFLPFNVAEPVRPALGRQLAHFLHETIKNQPDTETHYLTAMAQIGEGPDREAAFVNFSDKLNDKEFLRQLIGQTGADYIVDGLLTDKEPGYVLTLRVYTGKLEDEPMPFEKEFRVGEIFDMMKWMVSNVAGATGTQMQPGFEQMPFGTDDAEAFRDFLVGFDAVAYLQQAGNQAAKAFDVGIAFDSLISAIDADHDFLGPYEAALQLARLCAQHNVGNFQVVEEKIKKVIDTQPEDWRGHFVLGELYMAADRLQDANSKFEKAVFFMEQDYRKAQKEIEEGKPRELPALDAAVYTRLGMSQLALGMVVNAERTFRKASELETGEQRPSLDLLSAVLAQSGRAHEIPWLWKQVVDNEPTHGEAWAKYAIALAQNGKDDESRKAFEEGLEKTNGAPIVKRYFAPYLVGKEEFNRAMDLYEDCIDVAPKDVQLLLEYAQTLDRAGRQHEVPDVLNAVLGAEPDPNTKAQTLAWLYEIEQPKRVEAMQRAQEKIEKEDFAGALADLEPLVEWMRDYWKPWLLLAQLYNRLNRWTDAERAATHLINVFPACEPAYAELGQALSQQDRDEEAYRMLSFALRAMPGSLLIAVNLALAAKRAGHLPEARQLASQIRQAVGNENIEINRALAEIEAS